MNESSNDTLGEFQDLSTDEMKQMITEKKSMLIGTQ